MSVKNPAWRYLPKERPRDSDERSLMFDRANATESVIRILNDEFDCGIPEGGEGKSWKFFCPWGDEHSDAGLDKAARYFWDTDHVYCFAGHDVLDVVTIRAMQWHVTKYEAARRLLTKYAEVRVPYAVRLATLAAKVRAPEQPRALSIEQAQQALVAALSSVQGYTESQYRPEVREALAGSLEALQGHWGMDDVLGWVEESCGRVASAIAQGESYAKQG